MDFKWNANLIRLDLDVEKYIIWYLIRVFFPLLILTLVKQE